MQPLIWIDGCYFEMWVSLGKEKCMESMYLYTTAIGKGNLILALSSLKNALCHL